MKRKTWNVNEIVHLVNTNNIKLSNLMKYFDVETRYIGGNIGGKKAD